MTDCTLLEATQTMNVGMGQASVGGAECTLQSVLGSCIGLVLHHPRMKYAAMAHVVLPDSAGRDAFPAKFADTAVPHLIAELAKLGVPSSGLVAKIAGAASMFGVTGPMQIGESNIAAVRKALQKAGLPIMGENLGGNKGRRVQLNCVSGTYTIEILGQPVVKL
jgi:chemotaxis protein CheD